MANQWQCWCGAPKGHGGNKKLAAKHSAIAKKRYEEEKEKYPHLFVKEKKRVVLPDDNNTYRFNGKNVRVQ